MSEESAAGNVILRAVELKQKQLTWRQRLETLLPARLPEVDLVDTRALAQKAIPIVVCYADVEFHDTNISVRP